MEERITFKQILGIFLTFFVILPFMIYILYVNNDVRLIKHYLFDNYNFLGLGIYLCFVIGFGIVFWYIGEIIRRKLIGRTKKEIEIYEAKKLIKDKYNQLLRSIF